MLQNGRTLRTLCPQNKPTQVLTAALCWLLWEGQAGPGGELGDQMSKRGGWTQVDGGRGGRFRVDFEGRADSMADMSDVGGFENMELLAVEMGREDVG